MLRNIKTLAFLLLFIGTAQAQDLTPSNCYILSGTITCGANSISTGTGGPFLPLTGGTLSGSLLVSSGNVQLQSGDFSGANANISGIITGANLISTGIIRLPGNTQLQWNGVGLLNFNASGTLLVADQTGSSFNRMMLGGTTASFPAIKRNGTQIDFRLADDSNYTTINANVITATTNFNIQSKSVLSSPSDGIFSATNNAGTSGATISAGNLTLTNNINLVNGSQIVGAGGASITLTTQIVTTGDIVQPSTGTLFWNGRGSITSAGANNITTAGISASNLTLSAIGTDAGSTDNTVCVDSSGNIKKGSGVAGICLGTSSMRYKNSIIAQSDGLSKINALKPVNYFYNKGFGDDGAREMYGFLAEDVIKVLPKLVGLDNLNRPNSVDMVGMIPILVKAIQDQQKEIDALKANPMMNIKLEPVSKWPNYIPLTQNN